MSPALATNTSEENKRVQHILLALREGKEMDVTLSEEEFGPERPFPPKPDRLRVWLSLHRMDLPLVTKLSRHIVQSDHLKNFRGEFVPGFRCHYGRIYSEDASLFDTVFVDYANIYIGRGTGFSYQNLVLTSNHVLDDMRFVRTKEIVIGENVWISSRVVILPGVRIGRNSVVAAGSVVASDIPPGVLAAGIPAKPIKSIRNKLSPSH